MNTKGVNFQPSKRGQFSAAVDSVAATVKPETLPRFDARKYLG